MHYDGQEFTFGVEPSKPSSSHPPNTPPRAPQGFPAASKPPVAAQHSFAGAPDPPPTPVQDLATAAPSLALPADQQNFTEVRPLLRSVLRPATCAMRRSHEPTASTALQWPWTRFGHELVEIDLPDGPVLATFRHAGAWGVSADTVRAAARKNIARIHPPGINEPDHDAVFFDPDRSSYLTSAILTPGWLAALRYPSGSRPVAFVPTEDTLIVGNDDPVAGMKYFEMAEDIYAEAERPVSPEAFTVAGDRVVPFVNGGPHPLRALAVRARTHAAVRQYREQTEFLTRAYAEDSVDVEVPGVQAVQTPRGLASVAVWPAGGACDLPLVDYLWLAGEDGSGFAVPFSAVTRVVGIVLIPIFHPHRYRVSGWPDPGLIDALRCHAVPLQLV